MIENLLAAISQFYPLEEQDAGAFQSIRKSGMTFALRVFTAKGLGHVSVLTASGFLGLMKMHTLIINPFEIDMPLLSCDRIQAPGSDTLLLEVFDTQLQPGRLIHMDNIKRTRHNLPSHDPENKWYDSLLLPVSVFKQGSRRYASAFDALTGAFLDAFLDDSRESPACDRSAKRKRAADFTEKLLQNGGPSTDFFQNAIGKEQTSLLFRSYVFGTNT